MKRRRFEDAKRGPPCRFDHLQTENVQAAADHVCAAPNPFLTSHALLRPFIITLLTPKTIIITLTPPLTCQSLSTSPPPPLKPPLFLRPPQQKPLAEITPLLSRKLPISSQTAPRPPSSFPQPRRRTFRPKASTLCLPSSGLLAAFQVTSGDPGPTPAFPSPIPAFPAAAPASPAKFASCRQRVPVAPPPRRTVPAQFPSAHSWPNHRKATQVLPSVRFSPQGLKVF